MKKLCVFFVGLLFFFALLPTYTFAQIFVTPTLYCLAPNCSTSSFSDNPEPSIIPAAPRQSTAKEPCSDQEVTTPMQPSETNAVHKIHSGHHEEGFLFAFFALFLVLIGLLLQIGGQPCPAIVATPTVEPTAIVRQTSIMPSEVQSPMPTISGTQTTGAKTPNQILPLQNWHLTLPIGKPTTISSAQLTAGYQDPYFHTDDKGEGVLFHAPVQGATTINSDHTRSELREISPQGKLPWGWSAGSGSHVMTAIEAIIHLPGGPGKSGRVSFAQIHGINGQWYLILEAADNNNGTATLKVHDQTNKINGTIIDDKYVLGTKFTLIFSAVNGTVTVNYNGVTKATTTSTLQNAYFKIGAYNQSAGDYGEVAVYSLSVQHH